MRKIDFSNRSSRFILHLLMWVVIFILPFIMYKAHDRPGAALNPQDRISFLYLNIFTDFLWIGSFYLNGLWLMPKLFDKKKYAQYLTAILLIFILSLGIHFCFFQLFASEHIFKILNATSFLLPPFVLSLAASGVWAMWQQKLASDRLLQEKNQENLKTELAFLRSQISPHFIFNILNNITALIRMKSEEAETAIIKLSSLLQYMLYETDEKKVPLKTEVEYLQSYIDLQKQRFGKRIEISTSFQLDNNWLEIEPMLLIPFVENAFKHGAGHIKNPSIEISLVTIKNMLQLRIANKYNPDIYEVKDKTSGIGLNNVKRRLDLLYANKNSLQIERNNQQFVVTLELHLQS